jgi:DNA-binding MarR family transcriptional regulator
MTDRMRAIDAAVTARVHAKLLEHHDGKLGIAHARVMADLGAGSRPSEIARRLGVTKAAVGQLLGPLEEQGLVTRVPDPSDGRALIFKPTSKAARLYAVARREIDAVEAEWKRALGPRRFDQLAASLEILDGWRLSI